MAWIVVVVVFTPLIRHYLLIHLGKHVSRKVENIKSIDATSQMLDNEQRNTFGEIDRKNFLDVVHPDVVHQWKPI